MRTHDFHYKNVEFRTKKGVRPFNLSNADLYNLKSPLAISWLIKGNLSVIK